MQNYNKKAEGWPAFEKLKILIGKISPHLKN